LFEPMPLLALAWASSLFPDRPNLAGRVLAQKMGWKVVSGHRKTSAPVSADAISALGVGQLNFFQPAKFGR
jgi:hypothetical protein